MRILLLTLTVLLMFGCRGYNPAKSTHPPSEQLAIDTAIAKFKESSPGIQAYFDHSYGYVVFPSVGKAGLGLGGARDTDGKVYEQGKYIGDATLTEFNIGLQAGAQSFREIIFFENKAALEKFTKSRYEFDAGASSVAASAGATADADFDRGVAVFTQTNGGLMLEASVGGQKFRFYPAY